MNERLAVRIDSCLASFDNHQLSDLSKAELMDRVDSKFILPISRVPEILLAIRDDYSALEISGKRIFQYDNTYYDTDDMRFFNTHHNGKLNRFKVRYRHYVDTDSRYLEVKFKNNRKRTVKKRIRTDATDQEAVLLSSGFLNQCGVEDEHHLKPVQRGGYKRIALARESAGERLTIDMGLHFRKPSSSAEKRFQHCVVAELKQASMDRTSPFYQIMRNLQIRSGSFSKYCMGMCVIGDENIKTNRFKATALRVIQTNENAGV